MSDKHPERVLVIGDDMRIFLAVVRSLGRAGKEVHAAPFDWHAPALKSRYISEIHYLPCYSDDPRAWLSSIMSVLREQVFELIIPCCDRAILPLDFHRSEFAGYRIAIPDREAMSPLFDKRETRSLAVELGIPVAPGGPLRPEDDARSLAHLYGLPLVIKPRQSYWLDRLYTWGTVYIVETIADLERVLDATTDRSRYLAESLFKGGVGVGLSVLAESGRILHAFQHRRVREGRGGSSSYRVSEGVNAQLLTAAEKICERTRLTGVCMFEFRWNPETRQWILLETNARFWGSCALPIAVGVDFPRFLYDLTVHRKHHESVPYRTGIRSRNLVLDGYNLLCEMRYVRPANAVGYLLRWGDYFAQPIAWLTGRERSDSFAKDDPRPGFAEFRTLAGTLRRKLRRVQSSDLRRGGSERGVPPSEPAVLSTSTGST
jgi:predicted ATP-grasp superfamily ATP-dependent carboligase